ncbi:MAG: hypothetical protein BJ554DRAFT_4418 [Olpidium bornovanus]|uniref:Large ribosomal subunit protein eL39 n=1 Tax=Olpidium bornovanus TaxID=278681 RepID=A0A8H7ZZY1_9FUNG|nr:MAG: hypothetical protein BJ554DRAFT_4418 [Olpidium bornovanus]
MVRRLRSRGNQRPEAAAPGHPIPCAVRTALAGGRYLAPWAAVQNVALGKPSSVGQTGRAARSCPTLDWRAGPTEMQELFKAEFPVQVSDLFGCVRHWARSKFQPSHKSFKTKRILGKAQRQNRPIPQWIRLRTGNTIRCADLRPAFIFARGDFVLCACASCVCSLFRSAC